MAINRDKSTRLQKMTKQTLLNSMRGVTVDKNGAVTARKDGKTPDASKFVGNLEVKTFNGMTYGDDGRGSNTAQMTVNFATMSDIGQVAGQTFEGRKEPALFKTTNPKAFESEYTGATPSGKPITFEAEYNPSDNENPVTFSPVVDFKALATASFMEKEKAAQNSKDRYYKAPTGKAREMAKDRVDLTYAFTTTHNGVAGMSEQGIASNIAKAAQQNYILTTGKGNIDTNKPQAETIKGLANEFSTAYKDLMGKAIKGELKNGLPQLVKGEDGKYTPGTSAIAGTQCDLSGKGLVMHEADGCLHIGLEKDGANTSEINKQLVGFNNYFNRYMTQQLNEKYPAAEKDPTGVALKNMNQMVDLNAYLVSPPGANGVALVQPTMTAKISAFSAAVVKAHDAALHTEVEVDGQVKQQSVSDMYDDKIIQNANDIVKDFDNTMRDAEGQKLEPMAAAKVTADTYKAISETVKSGKDHLENEVPAKKGRGRSAVDKIKDQNEASKNETPAVEQEGQALGEN